MPYRVLPILKIVPLIFFLFTACSTPKEVIVDRYANGVKKKVTVLEDTIITTIKTYHFNALRATELEVVNGRPHGRFQSWRSDGTLNQTGEYIYGKKEGLWLEWYGAERPLQEQSYIDGIQEGPFKKFYPSGSLWVTGTYINNLPRRTHTTYYRSGSIKNINGCFEPASQTYTAYFESGALQENYLCNDSLKTDLYRAYYSNGQTRISGFFKNGKPEAIWSYYTISGTITSLESYYNNQKHGLFTRFSATGDTLARAFFHNGSGILITQCPHNLHQTCSDSTWVNGLLHGMISYSDTTQQVRHIEQWNQGVKLHEKKYRNGTLVLEGGYLNNRREGPWNIYYQSGVIKERLNFKDDDYIGLQQLYDSTGTLTMKRHHYGKGKKVEVEIVK
ncbi:MAG: hypothetical protein OCC49_10900 [Fibrobacterales bacterium]